MRLHFKVNMDRLLGSPGQCCLVFPPPPWLLLPKPQRLYGAHAHIVDVHGLLRDLLRKPYPEAVVMT